MLTIFNGNDGYPIANDDYYIRELASGMDEVIVNISIRDPIYQYVKEEAIIRDRDQNRYVIKQIDQGDKTAKVVAQIDVDAWKASILTNYSNNSATVGQTVNGLLPAGWGMIDESQSTIQRTIPTSDKASDYNVTPLEVLKQCMTTYNVRFRFDTATKIIHIIDPVRYTSKGAFATRDLNLKKLNYKGKSENFVTRLYAMGANGLTFKSINNNKDYVENFDYSNKVICAFWKDERYTSAESLLADATTKLTEMAKPTQSFDCDVFDLANTNPDMYGFEDFSLFEIITLIDDAKETRTDFQIMERWTYPYYPARNKVILSTSTPNIQSTVVAVVESLENSTSDFQQMIQSAIDNTTALITGNEGGYVVLHDSNGDGMPDELLVMNTASIATATKVWRWNTSGLGYSSNGYNGTYALGMTMNGQIVADLITTGTLTANLIRAGILQDLQGNNSWNLQTGDLSLSVANGTIRFSVSSNGLSWNSTNSSMTTAGVLSATAAALTNCTISGGSFTVKNGNNTIFSISASGLMWNLTNSQMSTDGSLYVNNLRTVRTESGTTYDSVRLASGNVEVYSQGMFAGEINSSPGRWTSGSIDTDIQVEGVPSNTVAIYGKNIQLNARDSLKIGANNDDGIGLPSGYVRVYNSASSSSYTTHRVLHGIILSEVATSSGGGGGDEIIVG